jgi:hypothetical protein
MSYSTKSVVLSLEEAKKYVESTAKLGDNYTDHAFVYRVGDKFGVLWHPEDRYLIDYLPSGAHVVLHAKRSGRYENATLTWEERGTIGKDDVQSLLDALGAGRAIVIASLFDDEDE